jgi:hypothetical protein
MALSEKTSLFADQGPAPPDQRGTVLVTTPGDE